jgi:hypothetical protein
VGGAFVKLETLSEEGAQAKNEYYLMQIAEQLFPASSERAAQRGFAIGPVLIASKHQQEIASLVFRSEQVPDVLVRAYINGLSPNPDPSLLGRWDSNIGILVHLFPNAPSVVRRGKVVLGGMGGEELLTKAHLHDRLVLKFNAKSQRDNPTLEAPLIEFHLNTEPVGPASDWQPPLWTEKETVAVWDRIVRSVRPRPCIER